MTPGQPAAIGPTAPLRRRFASLGYESLLLFGIGLIPAVVGTVFFALTGQRHPWQSETTVRIFALVVYGVYFVWFWSARGQTLAMQTWRIGLSTSDGGRVSQGRALARYMVACVGWLALPVGVAHFAGLSPWPTLAGVAGWILAYALLSLAEPDRQFWHDRLCRTRLVDLRERKKPAVERGPTAATEHPR